MSERPATYDCGATCTCDAVTDLAAERTELMEEMAAALGEARIAIEAVRFGTRVGDIEERITVRLIAAERKARAVLAKYRGEGE